MHAVCGKYNKVNNAMGNDQGHIAIMIVIVQEQNTPSHLPFGLAPYKAVRMLYACPAKAQRLGTGH